MEYIFNINGKTYIANKGGTAYVANKPLQAYAKEEMASFLSENVSITGWADAGDGTNVTVSFTPITDERALAYLNAREDNDGDMVFFQLLRHKTYTPTAGKGRRSKASPVYMPTPREFVRGDYENEDGEPYGDYVRENIESGAYGPNSSNAVAPIRDYSQYAKTSTLDSHGEKPINSADGATMSLYRTNGYFDAAVAAKHPSSKGWVRLDAESAEAGEITLPWRDYLQWTAGWYAFAFRTYFDGGSTDGSKIRGLAGKPYIVWAPEIVVQSSKASWFDDEENAVRPERAYVSYFEGTVR